MLVLSELHDSYLESSSKGDIAAQGREATLVAAGATNIASASSNNSAIIADHGSAMTANPASNKSRQPRAEEESVAGVLQHGPKVDSLMTPARWRLRDQQDMEKRLQAAHKLVQEVQKRRKGEREQTSVKRPLEEEGGLVPLRTRRIEHTAPKPTTGSFTTSVSEIESHLDGKQTANTQYNQHANGLLTPRSTDKKPASLLQVDARFSKNQVIPTQSVLEAGRSQKRVLTANRDDSNLEHTAHEDSPTAFRSKKRRLDVDHSLMSAPESSLERDDTPTDIEGSPEAGPEEALPHPPVRRAATAEAAGMPTTTATGVRAAHLSGGLKKEKQYILFEGVMLPRKSVMER